MQVYSLDMDTRYLAEEQALRNYAGFADTDILMLQPRGPGEPMWPEIMPPQASPAVSEPASAGTPAEAGGKGAKQPAAGDKKPAAAAAPGKDAKGSPQKGAAPSTASAEPVEVNSCFNHRWSCAQTHETQEQPLQTSCLSLEFQRLPHTPEFDHSARLNSAIMLFRASRA